MTNIPSDVLEAGMQAILAGHAPGIPGVTPIPSYIPFDMLAMFPFPQQYAGTAQVPPTAQGQMPPRGPGGPGTNTSIPVLSQPPVGRPAGSQSTRIPASTPATGTVPQRASVVDHGLSGTPATPHASPATASAQPQSVPTGEDDPYLRAWVAETMPRYVKTDFRRAYLMAKSHIEQRDPLGLLLDRYFGQIFFHPLGRMLSYEGGELPAEFLDQPFPFTPENLDKHDRQSFLYLEKLRRDHAAAAGNIGTAGPGHPPSKPSAPAPSRSNTAVPPNSGASAATPRVNHGVAATTQVPANATRVVRSAPTRSTPVAHVPSARPSTAQPRPGAHIAQSFSNPGSAPAPAPSAPIPTASVPTAVAHGPAQPAPSCPPTRPVAGTDPRTVVPTSISAAAPAAIAAPVPLKGMLTPQQILQMAQLRQSSSSGSASSTASSGSASSPPVAQRPTVYSPASGAAAPLPASASQGPTRAGAAATPAVGGTISPEALSAGISQPQRPAARSSKRKADDEWTSGPDVIWNPDTPPVTKKARIGGPGEASPSGTSGGADDESATSTGTEAAVAPVEPSATLADFAGVNFTDIGASSPWFSGATSHIQFSEGFESTSSEDTQVDWNTFFKDVAFPTEPATCTLLSVVRMIFADRIILTAATEPVNFDEFTHDLGV